MAVGNGTRIALAALAALGLFGAIVLAVPPRSGGGTDPATGPEAPSADATPAAPDPAAERASVPPDEEAAAPAFDTVRIEPDGTGVVAGRAEPGSTVAILAAGEVAAEAVADAQGSFVAFLDLPPSDAPRELTLRMGEGGPVAAASILLAPMPGAPVAEAEDTDPTPEGATAVAEEAPSLDAEAGIEAVASSDLASVGHGDAASGDAGVAAPATPPPDAPDGAPEASARAGAEDRAPLVVAPAPGETREATAPSGGSDEVAAADPEASGPPEVPAPAVASVEATEPSGPRPSETQGAPEAVEAGDGATTEPSGAPVDPTDAGPETGVADPVAVADADAVEIASPAPVEAEPPGGPQTRDEEPLSEEPPAQGASPVEAEPVADAPPATPPVIAAGEPVGLTAPTTDPGASPPGALPPVAPADAPAATASPAVSADPAVSDEAPSVATQAPGLAAPEPEGPGQVPVLVADAEGVRVLQPALAPGAGPEVLRTVALDAIAYDDAGGVRLSGRATGGGEVRAYLDNAPVETAPVGPDGQWALALEGTAPGVYTLRIDQVGPDGTVLSRIETPFKREERDALAVAMSEAQEAGQTIAVRTVQPGHTLWAISRDRYGDGMMYVQVFAMNRDRIRNPDLIYPGQVFVLPATDGR